MDGARPHGAWRDRFVGAALIGASTIVLFVLVDFVYGLVFPVKPYAGSAERLTAAAYRNEPYFSESFLAESFTQPGGWETPPGTRIVVPKPYDGEDFHVDVLPPTRLPYRRTINPEATGRETRIVLVLGGSTIYNSEVPDRLTVTSQLSALLNAADGPRYVVLNAGVSSVNTTQERERLEAELARGLQPWGVVTVTGINDVNQGVYFGNPEGVMFSGDQRSPVKEWLRDVLPLNMWRSFRTAAQQANTRTVPPHLGAIESIDSLAQETADVYERNVAAMYRMSRSADARFWCVLQPHLYSTEYERPESADLREVAELTERTLPRSHVAFERGYRALREATSRLRQRGVAASDASALFAAKTDDIFLDMAHVNSIGNRMLAEHLAGLILADAAVAAPP
jgi:lysophospholipase L1-like esterase